MALRVISTRNTKTYHCSPRCLRQKSISMVRSFSTTTQKSWRKSFEEFLKTNNIGLQDWYQVDIKKLDGKTSKLVNDEFKGSLYHAVSTLFPEKEWHPWKFTQERLSSDFWKELKNQRKFFDDLGKQNGIQNLNDWYYKLSSDLLIQNGARSLLEQYNNSPRAALMAAYPEHTWIPWKFNSTPRGYWKEQSNQRKFFDDLGKKIGIRTLDDWYLKLTFNLIVQHGEEGPPQFKRSPVAALEAAYPDHKWIPWDFTQLPQGQRKDLPKQYQFFEDLGKKVGIQSLDDWYEKLSFDLIAQNGGSGLLKLYNNSPQDALMATYPQHKWMSSNFYKLYQEYWTKPQNQRKFFDALGKELGVKTLDDWYQQLSFELLVQYGGRLVMKLHNNSPANALMAAYPEHNWMSWKFNYTPQGFWKEQSNQRKFFDDLGKQIGVQSLDDWYQKLTFEVIAQNGGRGFVQQYKSSPVKALMAAYPEHNWILWKFSKLPQNYWAAPNNMKQFLSELSEKLSIQTLDDWYRVDMIQLNLLGATTLMKKYKGLYNLLKEQYPNHPWDSKRFQHGGKKGQRWLAVTLKKMFPNEEILEDYMHPKVTLSSTHRPMQLDVFVPSKSLAFEYQGQQHYEDVGVFSPTRTYQQRDEEKRILCAANNIKLIEVPYWWNRTQESLQEIMGSSLNK